MPKQSIALQFNPSFILWVFLLPVLAFIVVSALNNNLGLAPDVTFNTITGKKIALHDLRGKPVLVTFWATDCPGCLQEIPDLVALHQQGLDIIAVAMSYDPPNHVIDLSKAHQLSYHIALDLTADIARAFGNVNVIPSTFLIAPNGAIVLQKMGAINADEIKTFLKTLKQG
ncbi:MAG: TlpA disulfide reductase family protein [Methylococcales bacterium]|nr:TlpA disulfide reductase family protein [Methylococcales bacterium]